MGVNEVLLFPIIAVRFDRHQIGKVGPRTYHQIELETVSRLIALDHTETLFSEGRCEVAGVGSEDVIEASGDVRV